MQLRNRVASVAGSLPRIIAVYPDECLLEILEGFLLASFTKVRLLAFENPTTAWAQLARKAPDLLITGDAMPCLGGQEIVGRLVARGAHFRVIVLSGWEGTKGWVSDYASRGFNIRYLPMPFTAEELQRSLPRNLAAKVI